MKGKSLILLVSIIIVLMSGVVDAGHWDEHFVMQIIINEWVISSGYSWLDNEVSLFVLGLSQHQIYDLLVNERPLNLYKLYHYLNDSFFKSKEVAEKYIEFPTEELPTIILNITGISICIGKSMSFSRKEGNWSNFRKRLIGFLGSITPDLLEVIRLTGRSSSGGFFQTWREGDANNFHIIPDKNWRFLTDTFHDNKSDLRRRILLQLILLFL